MIRCFFKNPVILFGIIVSISLAALAAAFIAEGFLGLEPCILCIYQRYPFAIAAILGVLGLVFRKKAGAVYTALSLSAIAFLTNSAIAFYHTGVEQKWWNSAVEGCSVPLFEDKTDQGLLENIMSAPMGHCSEIPWQDPVLGLSMANYNIILCFGLFVYCVIGLCCVKKCR